MASTTHNKRPHLFADAIAAQNAGIETALRESIYRSVEMFERFGAFIARRRAASAAFRELSEMTDRELADLGIARVDIRAVVNGKAARHG
jgi:uncharacterized protein YjiS (DUF1127 family)